MVTLPGQKRIHRVKDTNREIPIPKLSDQHLENIIKKHCKNLNEALAEPPSCASERSCWIVINFVTLIQPYQEEAARRGILKDFRWVVEAAHRKHNAADVVGYENRYDDMYDYYQEASFWSFEDDIGDRI